MDTLILGAGITGLAAGLSSGLPVYEASRYPGGICSSYYVRPGETQRLHSATADGEAYRFEIGGGHWIFGGDPTILHFISSLTTAKRYARRSGVWFPQDRSYVPYPLQNHLRFLPNDIARRALLDIVSRCSGAGCTMEDWLLNSFGSTLCEKFFVPFHQLYTAGLYKQIAPQDGFKSPVDIGLAIEGAFGEAKSVGYNVTYLYPSEGLNVLTQRMAARCDIHYGKQAVTMDTKAREVHFADGTAIGYSNLICTLPLDRTMELTGLAVDEPADPYTSVLVLNVGAKKGRACPDDHWLYHPESRSGFHRVGFYSNVDATFLPMSSRAKKDRVSIYVERAYAGGAKPSNDETRHYCESVVQELTDWGFIECAEVADPTWIDSAYTWSRPGSQWKPKALKLLEQHGIYMVGRYARWIFQGIAESIRDGFFAGASFRNSR